MLTAALERASAVIAIVSISFAFGNAIAKAMSNVIAYSIEREAQ